MIPLFSPLYSTADLSFWLDESVVILVEHKE